jgi:hypothetical protein
MFQHEDTWEIICSANKTLEMSLWMYSRRMDREVIIKYAFELYMPCVYSFPYYLCLASKLRIM